MGTITIEPKNPAEFQLLTSMLKKMKIKMKLNLTDEEKEDLGMYILMQEADNNDLVSRDEIMSKLRKPKQAAVAI
jgi:hypothetical protein